MKLFMSEPATENSQLESLIALCGEYNTNNVSLRLLSKPTTVY